MKATSPNQLALALRDFFGEFLPGVRNVESAHHCQLPGQPGAAPALCGRPTTTLCLRCWTLTDIQRTTDSLLSH